MPRRIKGPARLWVQAFALWQPNKSLNQARIPFRHFNSFPLPIALSASKQLGGLVNSFVIPLSSAHDIDTE